MFFSVSNTNFTASQIVAVITVLLPELIVMELGTHIMPSSWNLVRISFHRHGTWYAYHAIVMELGTHIMPSEPILVAYIIDPFHY
jgi:hypothetical protein